MSISDELMLRYYELLSDLSLNDIDNLKIGLKAHDIHPMEAKKQLGRELTARYHGQDAAILAEESFVKRFRDNQTPEDMPEVTFDAEDTSVLLCKLLASLGLVPSNSEGRRAIKGGGVKVDGEKIADENSELAGNGSYVIQVGKRRFAKVKII